MKSIYIGIFVLMFGVGILVMSQLPQNENLHGNAIGMKRTMKLSTIPKDMLLQKVRVLKPTENPNTYLAVDFRSLSPEVLFYKNDYQWLVGKGDPRKTLSLTSRMFSISKRASFPDTKMWLIGVGDPNGVSFIPEAQGGWCQIAESASQERSKRSRGPTLGLWQSCESQDCEHQQGDSGDYGALTEGPVNYMQMSAMGPANTGSRSYHGEADVTKRDALKYGIKDAEGAVWDVYATINDGFGNPKHFEYTATVVRKDDLGNRYLFTKDGNWMAEQDAEAGMKHGEDNRFVSTVKKDTLDSDEKRIVQDAVNDGLEDEFNKGIIDKNEYEEEQKELDDEFKEGGDKDADDINHCASLDCNTGETYCASYDDKGQQCAVTGIVAGILEVVASDNGPNQDALSEWKVTVYGQPQRDRDVRPDVEVGLFVDPDIRLGVGICPPQLAMEGSCTSQMSRGDQGQFSGCAVTPHYPSARGPMSDPMGTHTDPLNPNFDDKLGGARGSGGTLPEIPRLK